MKIEAAYDIIQSLDGSVDPFSGERFPSPSLYKQVNRTQTVINSATNNSALSVGNRLTSVSSVFSAFSVVNQYALDGIGNVLAVYDASGTPIPASALGNRYLFQGREYSWASQLYHFRARWYDPATGRWLSNNPIGISGGLNQYVFCGNDPVNNADPIGLAVGGPGIVEGFIPIWGSGRQVINDFQTGCYGWGMVNTVVAVSDVFLVKTLAQMAGKGLWKTADKWHKMIEGKCPRLNPAKRWWHGTPDWFRYAEISGVGRLGNTIRGDNDDCK